ncbi:hypothetical protein ACO1O0_003735 [Amphichorda felina]
MSSSMSGGAPDVTDEDFSYITSQDLDDPNLGVPVGRHRSRSNASPDPEDDVLLIKNGGVIYPAHFPAYSIGDGKLRVHDIKERVGLMMDLSDRTTRRIKLLYKGQQLKDLDAPVREYHVKNKSEIMAVVPEGGDGSSPSEGEMATVDPQREGKSQKRRKKRSKKKGTKGDGDSISSARDSASNVESQSPNGRGSEALKKIEELSVDFRNNWKPMCAQFVLAPPSDKKKLEDEHRKISESVMQHILLKLDGIETDGIAEIRTRRKELVKEVQEALKKIDVVKAGNL